MDYIESKAVLDYAYNNGTSFAEAKPLTSVGDLTGSGLTNDPQDFPDLTGNPFYALSEEPMDRVLNDYSTGEATESAEVNPSEKDTKNAQQNQPNYKKNQNPANTVKRKKKKENGIIFKLGGGNQHSYTRPFTFGGDPSQPRKGEDDVSNFSVMVNESLENNPSGKKP